MLAPSSLSLNAGKGGTRRHQGACGLRGRGAATLSGTQLELAQRDRRSLDPVHGLIIAAYALRGTAPGNQLETLEFV